MAKEELAQIEQMQIFADQIELASNKAHLFITGDANKGSEKWEDMSFLYKRIAYPLTSCLDQCGLKIAKIGLKRRYQTSCTLFKRLG